MSPQTSQARSRAPRIAEAAVERARLSLVPRAGRRPAGRVPFVALISLLLVGGVAGLLFLNTSMQQVSFTATALEARAQALSAKEQGLQLDLDRLRDPQRVAVRARRLGMVPGETPAFIRLGDGRVLGKPVAATGLDSVRLAPLPTRRPKDLRPLTVKVHVKLPAVDGAPSALVTGQAGTKKSHDNHRHGSGSRR